MAYVRGHSLNLPLILFGAVLYSLTEHVEGENTVDSLAEHHQNS